MIFYAIRIIVVIEFYLKNAIRTFWFDRDTTPRHVPIGSSQADVAANAWFKRPHKLAKGGDAIPNVVLDFLFVPVTYRTEYEMR